MSGQRLGVLGRNEGGWQADRDTASVGMSRFQIAACPLDGVQVITARTFEDERGWFMESYSLAALEPLGVGLTFVQDNHSLSRAAGTLRGLHYQLPPFAQDKLVRCVVGRIWDVAVDVRRRSPTFGRWFGIELSAANRLQLLVPVGFAHGFMTLEPDSEVMYKVSATYSEPHETGIRWDDPTLAIDWPVVASDPVLSDRDRRLPSLDEATLF